MADSITPDNSRAVERIVRERVNAALDAAATKIDAVAHEYRDDDAGFHYQDAAELVRSQRVPPLGEQVVAEQMTEVDRIEEALSAHVMDLAAVIRDRSTKAGYTLGCACGYRWEPDPEVDHHRRHVAAALAERRVIPLDATSLQGVQHG